jgi:hypothetical protein
MAAKNINRELSDKVWTLVKYCNGTTLFYSCHCYMLRRDPVIYCIYLQFLAAQSVSDDESVGGMIVGLIAG